MNGAFIQFNRVKVKTMPGGSVLVLSIQDCAEMQDTTRDGWLQDFFFFLA